MTTSGMIVRRTNPMAGAKRLLRKYGPLVMWLGVASGVVVCVQQQPTVGVTRGLVEAVESVVVPAEDGMLDHVAVDLMDDVKAGQVLAIMDDKTVRAELSTADAELARLRAQLDAAEVELKRSLALEERKSLDERRRFAVNQEQARLDRLQLAAQQESDAMELERLRLDLQREGALLAKGMTSQETYDNARLHHDALAKKVRENGAAIAAATQNGSDAAQRQKEIDAITVDTDFQRTIEPVRRAISVQEARIAEIQARRKGLVLTAPAAGQVVSVLRRGGETVMAGQPIMNLRVAGPLRVVAYISEKALREVPVGTRAKLNSHYRPQIAAEAEVVKVGAQIVPLPAKLQNNPMVPEFGTAVVLAVLQNPAFYPGEYVNVTLESERE